MRVTGRKANKVKMTAKPLTKSYINTHDPEHPIQEDLVIYQLFEKARKDEVVGEIVNMETKERWTTVEVMKKVFMYFRVLS